MIDVLLILQAVLIFGVIVFTLGFAAASLKEREPRAAWLAVVICLVLVAVEAGIYFLYHAGFFIAPAGIFIFLVAGGATGVGIFFLVRRTDPNPGVLKGFEGYITGDVKRFDEREQAFARDRAIRPGTDDYRVFYQAHPHLEQVDAKRRDAGGILGTPGAIDRPREISNVSAMLAAFSIPPHFGRPESYHPDIQTAGNHRPDHSPEEATARVKGFARHLGAGTVGVTRTNPLWVYSRRGEIFYDRWEQWGKEITVKHPYTVVFAVEMEWEMVATAPHTPSVVESALSYSRGAWISTQLAAYIANLGYSATANHSRHYDLLMVPAAVDAGLGEMGRFGYLITRQLGPRVRIFAVTTDLPLVVDHPVDIGVEDFCSICKKCARCCPSMSIPEGDKNEVNGTTRWKLNAETCFAYWAKVGTDCNVCMRVCPWSHPRTFPHRVVISLIVRNKWARRLFFYMDEIFYGKKPRPKAAPKWAGL